MSQLSALIKKLKDLDKQIKSSSRKRSYSEKWEDEVRDIVETINLIFVRNHEFSGMTSLILPDRMPPEWLGGEDDLYDDLEEELKKNLKKCERAVKNGILYLETTPVIETTDYPKAGIIAPVSIKKTPKTKSVKKEKKKKKEESDKFVVKIPFLDMNLTTTEFIIFIIGLILGLVVGFVIGTTYF